MITDVSSGNFIKYNTSSSFNYLEKKTHKIRFEKVLSLIQTYKNSIPGKLKIVDLGCGNGFHTKRFLDFGLETYGVDLAEDSLKEASACGIKTLVGDFTKELPFEDNTFDIVYSGETIEHILDIRVFLTEINRVLKTGGLFILTTPNLAGLDDRLNFLFGKKPRHQDALCNSHYLHIRNFTFSSIEEVLNLSGFRIIKKLSNKVRIGKVFGKELESYQLANIFPTLGAAIIIGALKDKNVSEISFYEC